MSLVSGLLNQNITSISSFTKDVYNDKTYTVMYSDTPCRWQESTEMESLPTGEVITYTVKIWLFPEIEIKKGHRITKDNKNYTVMKINKKYDIDGDVSYNSAKYINHSCNPNCESVNTRGKIWIVAEKDIMKGEELTYNYGYDFEDFEDHECRCGSHNCVGYILSEDHWPKLRAYRARINKRFSASNSISR